MPERKRRGATNLLVVLALAGCGLAQSARADHLFSPSYVLPQAQAGWPVRVCPAPGLDLAAVVEPWNRSAGWTLLTASCEAPDVTYVPDATTWVEPGACRIHYATVSVHVHRHEIGHCLGFADHGAPSGGRWLNPGSCLGYRGVMSYCDWDGAGWFGADDALMLERAGYVWWPGSQDR